MYTAPASRAELAAFGLSEEDYASDFVYVWPEHRQAYAVFCAMGTQWRIVGGGMGGSAATGLDYNALAAVMALMGVPECERGDVFADVQVLEGAALEAMADARATHAKG